jgi:CheY-like chemotaxis protein
MKMEELNYYYNKFKFGEDIFHNLMQTQIKEILLVSTFYDAFIFEQDGRLSEQIFGEYRQLNLSTAPRITSVPSGKDALHKLEQNSYDLVILMMRIGEIGPFELSKLIKDKKPDLPVLLLLNVQSDLVIIENHKDEMGFIDDVFIWNGDTKLFLAMVKNIEDKLNVAHDTEIGLTRVILLIEDSVHYYSIFLPLLYSVIMRQTQRLIQEELTDINKRLRMRARPKVLLVHSYEDACEIYEKYKEYMVCIISDVKYSHEGKLDNEAGIKLIKKIKDESDDIPMILQSSEAENALKAKELGVFFIDKNSKKLLYNLRDFIIKNLGFGDFIFRDDNNKEIARVTTLSDFESVLNKVPDESLLYHSNSNHFSNWLVAHGEVILAKKIRPMKATDFPSVGELRSFLLNIFDEVRKEKSRGKIINFHEASLSEMNQIIRLSEGSLGGKGRGLAFLNALLVTMEFDKEFPEVSISLPSTAIIGTNEFDLFLEHLDNDDRITDLPDREIDILFLEGHLSEELMSKLDVYLDKVNYPIAVRSSGLLEDSQSQPFAGVYRTFMLPNNHPDKNIRLKQLTDAIKLVFASVYLKNARSYIEGLNYKTEEEKMAVIIQEIAGCYHSENHYYPHISGAAESYNFYPTSYMENADGIASIALGLGKSVVEGKANYRFCPKYPQLEPLQPEERIRNSQKEYYALNTEIREFNLIDGEDTTMRRLDLKTAEKEGSIKHLVSVWDYQNNRFNDSLATKGLRVLTFPGILKYGFFPLAEILQKILEIGEVALGTPVEIEFAVNLNQNISEKILPFFYILQIRPLSVSAETYSIDTSKLDKDKLFLYTEKGMGNGCIENIRDIIYLDNDRFDKTQTIKMQEEIEKINQTMKELNREFILIGPGRWGTRDRFLGVPVRWAQINKAKVIVETGLEDFIIEASQGTHFFHNIVAMQVGYLTIPYGSENDFLDWDWLHSQPIKQRGDYFVHSSFEDPLTIKMDGKKGLAIIEKCKP